MIVWRKTGEGGWMAFNMTQKVSGDLLLPSHSLCSSWPFPCYWLPINLPYPLTFTMHEMTPAVKAYSTLLSKRRNTAILLQKKSVLDIMRQGKSCPFFSVRKKIQSLNIFLQLKKRGRNTTCGGFCLQFKLSWSCCAIVLKSSS